MIIWPINWEESYLGGLPVGWQEGVPEGQTHPHPVWQHLVQIHSQYHVTNALQSQKQQKYDTSEVHYLTLCKVCIDTWMH